jgi:acyl-CoA dehydrogenase
MPYRSPAAEMHFLLENVAGFDRLAGTPAFAEMAPDTLRAILAEAARLGDEVLAPLQRIGDAHPARLENGQVRTPPGFAEAFGALARGGWLGLSASPAHGGLGLPATLATAVGDMMAGACLSLHLLPLLTQGQIEALEAHASAEMRALYLPKLVSGEWVGTMNLTEPQAGSDVGALRTVAEPLGDGRHAISGQKIYITWGDNDFSANICHLVLARLPDGAPGTKGISLFMVPKYLPDADGNPGTRNALRVVSLERKLGIHGSPTAVMEYDRAVGWLVGAPHGGMAAMFTMMNNARLGVGAQAIGVAEAAFQHAAAYAQERRQGRTPLGDGSGPIIGHADVRRMLATMKAEIRAARSIALACGVAIDMSRATGDAGWSARAGLLTPIAKTCGTEAGIAVADLGIQIHGGAGFIEATGAAQFLRDVRITSIYEGTNGIQAIDLVGRKMADGGAAAQALIVEVAAEAALHAGRFPTLAPPVEAAAGRLGAAVDRLLALPMNDRFAGALPFLRAFARVLGAHFHLRAAAAPAARPADVALAEVYILRLLPEADAALAAALAGAGALYALSDEDLRA